MLFPHLFPEQPKRNIPLSKDKGKTKESDISTPHP
jgi:hypothetical protein